MENAYVLILYKNAVTELFNFISSFKGFFSLPHCFIKSEKYNQHYKKKLIITKKILNTMLLN